MSRMKGKFHLTIDGQPENKFMEEEDVTRCDAPDCERAARSERPDGWLHLRENRSPAEELDYCSREHVIEHLQKARPGPLKSRKQREAERQKWR